MKKKTRKQSTFLIIRRFDILNNILKVSDVEKDFWFPNPS